MEQIKFVENELVTIQDLPNFSAGDTITVHYKIKEGDKERTQLFKGIVIQRRGKKATETFTVRKMSGNIGVERIFPLGSPFLHEIKVIKQGAVRRARIFYFRERTGKSARIREKKTFTKS